LMSLTDDLHKIDVYVEAVVRKVANQLFDVLDTKAVDGDKYKALMINNTTPAENYLTSFRWEEAKYPSTQNLKLLTELIQSNVGKLDEELKTKSAEYTNVLHSLSAEERKAGGNLLLIDLSDIVKQQHVVESEYLETLFVAVPKYAMKQWLAAYEKLTEFVVPKSSELIEEDNDYSLFRVVLFKRIAEDFKNAAREKKFTVREFKFDPNKSGKADRKKLEDQKDKLKTNLLRWCKINFSEAFLAWIHLKAIRVFVESVLRYGLPTNFQAMLLKPKKGKPSALRKVLLDLYGHLSSKAVFKDDDGEEDLEKFFPYVFLEVNMDFQNRINM